MMMTALDPGNPVEVAKEALYPSAVVDLKNKYASTLRQQDQRRNYAPYQDKNDQENGSVPTQC
ncbi:hypothetical protein [Massilia sp. CF038]|uniref:hypothetical protein n=1 Tax=Massilia sp. CF038 TaxID=1881045 RepID=UPI00091D95D6|nr:hypothetical protein [Massilia sp. CF038]SHH14478.1 hypothetical protein SAMN05428948_3009 [Massilia sp. CF038]